jgi:hypothetical protein
MSGGDYQAVYQEGYAQAFLELGFSEEFLLQMFSEATDSLTITATAKAVFLRAKAGGAEAANHARNFRTCRSLRNENPVPICPVRSTKPACDLFHSAERQPC